MSTRPGDGELLPQVQLLYLRCRRCSLGSLRCGGWSARRHPLSAPFVIVCILENRKRPIILTDFVGISQTSAAVFCAAAFCAVSFWLVTEVSVSLWAGDGGAQRGDPAPGPQARWPGAQLELGHLGLVRRLSFSVEVGARQSQSACDDARRFLVRRRG